VTLINALTQCLENNGGEKWLM